jgi:hypothetical protein
MRSIAMTTRQVPPAGPSIAVEQPVLSRNDAVEKVPPMVK